MNIHERRPVVPTRYGQVRGVRTERGGTAFRGIPYAASPVGEARLAPPRPHPGWDGVRDAARPGPAVPQGPSRLEAVMGARTPDWDEDGCLTVNIWTPPGGSAARPVLLWFHGGGFTSGCGGWDWYDGQRLAELGGIVVVTANYRLGPLGYLYLPEVGAVNLGCRDQAAVLRWVGDNIAAFGGDPRQVTVGGQSAGAFSALALAVDPATGGLVHRVLAQSGPWGIEPQDPADAAATATAYLRVLGLDRETEAGRALRAQPIEDLLAAYARTAAEHAPAGGIAPPMLPVLGGPGIPRGLRRAVADGALAGKAILLGSTDDEMTAFAAHRAADREADLMFHDGVDEIAGHCAASGTPAHVYRFTRRPYPDPGGLSATHCADLPFAFGNLDAYPEAPMLGPVTTADRALARAFGGALAAFAATGTPEGEGLTPWRTPVMHF
ncbi:carboxylesterase family protein [Streptomyces sp. NPDC052396]|uniref:carboxylesterase family protein n=1 Tax=Streptomyces sp. NPDC052396 TaxID=3365689 RepID=UPI0037CD5C30